MDCKNCQHKQWEEGDIEYSPPGWGVYICQLSNEVLPEDKAKQQGRLDSCPLQKA